MIRSFARVWRVVFIVLALAVPVAAQPKPDDSSARDASSSVERAISGHLATGKRLLQQGDLLGAQEAFRAILQLDATHTEALRLMTKAQQQLDAKRGTAMRAQQRLRGEAQDLAIKFAREKAREKSRQDVQAQAQVARARDQRIKFLYKQALALYQREQYAPAIDALQQMVLMDPAHPLVDDAQRLITRAETQLAGQRARGGGLARNEGAPVSELEERLAVKRMELETTLKHAKLAMRDKRYEQALELLQQVLAQDPRHAQAQHLLEETQEAKLRDERERLDSLVRHDETAMVNEVIKAQVLPPQRFMPLAAGAPPAAATSTAAAALRQPISVDFTDVPLGDVLEFLADAGTISIIPSPQLDLKGRRVSLKVHELPLELALKYLAKTQSLAYRVEQDAVLIATAEEFSNESLQTRVFFLHNGLSPFALETVAVTPNAALVMESIKELVERTVPQPSGSKVVLDERGGSLIVTNTAEHLAMVERLLTQLDVAPVQVLIEARFVEVIMTDLEHVGLEAILTGDLALQKKAQGDGTLSTGQAIASGGGMKFPALSREGEALNVTLQGVLTGTQFEAVLHLLDETQKTKTLSAPRVTTLNNRTAQIRVVDEFNFPTRFEVSLIQFDINGDGDFDDAGETEFANVPKDFKKRDVGILLNVTPSVGRDQKTVTLVLAPEVSAFSSFRDLGGGVTVPQFTSSQLTTSVVINNGQTVVLGGLMKDASTDEVTKVPFFGDLPMVGGLFRQKEATSTRRNLLIFITARVLGPRGEMT